MTRPAEASFQILDAHRRQVGEMVIERSEDKLLFGKFTPGRAFSDVEHLFREFEEAVSLQALRKIDELDAAIGTLVLYLRTSDGSQDLAIRDVQIWSDGSITCRLGATAQNFYNRREDQRDTHLHVACWRDAQAPRSRAMLEGGKQVPQLAQCAEHALKARAHVAPQRAVAGQCAPGLATASILTVVPIAPVRGMGPRRQVQVKAR